MTKFLSAFNKHFGADIREDERPLLESRVAHWMGESYDPDGETDDEVWYAAIDDVIAQRERDAT